MRAAAALVLAALVGGAGTGLEGQRVLRGKIVSSETKEPLANAAVRGAGMRGGACTATDGSFAVELGEGVRWLELAVPGWSGAVPLADDAAEVTLELNPQVVPLEPLLVSVARDARPRDGASRAEMHMPEGQPAAPDVKTLLQGRVVGAQMITSGTVGAGFRLVLRGLSSITGTNEPLVVLDGVVMSAPPEMVTRRSGSISSTGGLQDINPEDIEKIEILRGPAASALYGALGSHGVILVTTRRGRPAARSAEEGPLLKCPGWP